MKARADDSTPSWLPPVRLARDLVVKCALFACAARCSVTAVCVLGGIVPFAATGQSQDTVFQAMCLLGVATMVVGGLLAVIRRWHKSVIPRAPVAHHASPRRELILALLMAAFLIMWATVFALHPGRLTWSLDRQTPLDTMLPCLAALGRMHLVVMPNSRGLA